MSNCLVIVLTLNEERHIKRCIDSCRELHSDVLIVDSYSSDRTVEIASSLGCYILQNHFTGFADQFNWALSQKIVKKYDWILRVDADEYLNDRLSSSINDIIKSCPEIYGGFELKRNIIFLGSRIRFGGVGNIPVIRLFRRERGCCEHRLMDEHITVNGKVGRLSGMLIDHNLNSLSWWITKHNKYSSLEALEMLDLQFNILPKTTSFGNSSRLGPTVYLKRIIKDKIYSRLPPFVGPCFYFICRYIFLLGFADGYPGLFFHFLQAFWYRALVDAKIYQFRNLSNSETSLSHANLLRSLFGYSASSGFD